MSVGPRVKFHAAWYHDILNVVGSGEKIGWFRLKSQVGVSNSSMAGINVLSTVNRWTRYPFRICFPFS